MSQDTQVFQSDNVQLKELINNSWDGICIIDKKTNFIYLNDAISPMFGYSKEELLSQPLLAFVKKEYQQNFLQLLKSNIENSYNTDAKLVCIRKDQQSIYIKMTVSLMTNKKYFVVNVKDITKEISDEKILNDYVLSLHLDTDEKINKVSNAFCKLSGYSKEALNSKCFYDLKHHEMRADEFNKQVQDLKDNKIEHAKFKLINATNEAFYVDIKLKAIKNKYGDIIGHTLLMFDITNELLLDQQLSIENAKLTIMGETITTISHEWRQPLNIISLKAQNLQFEIEDNDSLQILEDIQQKAQELSNTIENFQNIIKLNSAKKKVCVDELIDKSIRKFNEIIPNQMVFKRQGGFNKKVELYDAEILKVLNSLYYNSHEAFERQKIKEQTIILDVYAKNNLIHINIIDNAGGIPAEALPRIYEPYFSTKEERHGVGLGLYMTKTILQMHLGGSIDIDNIKDGVFIKIKIPFT